MRFMCLTLMLSVLSLYKPSVAQTKPPTILLQALHCANNDHYDLLETKLEKEGTVKASFTPYSQTDPHMEGLVLVIYDSDSKGEVLDFIREFAHGKLQLYVVNNATFSINPNKVVSVNDALGGVWIQGHLKMRVKRAMQTSYSIPKRSLATTFQNVGCQYYWAP
jgi:hypothetical protein